MDENILARVPGQYLARATQTLCAHAREQLCLVVLSNERPEVDREP
jgi:hypothetical protein